MPVPVVTTSGRFINMVGSGVKQGTAAFIVTIVIYNGGASPDICTITDGGGSPADIFPVGVLSGDTVVIPIPGGTQFPLGVGWTGGADMQVTFITG